MKRHQFMGKIVPVKQVSQISTSSAIKNNYGSDYSSQTPHLISISCQVSVPIIVFRLVAFLNSKNRAGADRSRVWSNLYWDRVTVRMYHFV